MAESRIWAAERPEKAPAITDRQIIYLNASVEAEEVRASEITAAQNEREKALSTAEQALRSRAKLRAAAFAAVSVLALALGWQWRGAERQTEIAQRERQLAEQARNDAQEQTRRADGALNDRLEREASFLHDAAVRSRRLGDTTTSILLLLEELSIVERMDAKSRVKVSAENLRHQLAELLPEMREKAVLEEPGTQIKGIAFAPDGAIVTGSLDGTLNLRQARVFTPLERPQKFFNSEVKTVRFSTDMTHFAAAAEDGTLRLFRVQPGVALRLDGLKERALPKRSSRLPIYNVSFAENGNLLAAVGGAHAADLLDLKAMRWMIGPGHSDEVQQAFFSQDGTQLLSSSYDGRARLWSLADGRPPVLRHEFPLRGGANPPATDFRSDIGLVVISQDQSIEIYRADASGQNWTLEGTLVGHTKAINDVLVARNGAILVSAADDATIRIWDLGAQQEIIVLGGHQDVINNLALSSDGRLLASTGFDGTARVWTIDGLPRPTILRGHRNYLLSIAVDPINRRFATTSATGEVWLWDLDTGRRTQKLGGEVGGHTNWVRTSAFSEDGKLLATAADDNTLRIWETSEKGTGLKIEHGLKRIRSVAFCGARLMVAAIEGEIAIIDPTAPTSPPRVLGHHSRSGAGQDIAETVSCSADGRIAVSAGSDGFARFWDPNSGEALDKIEIRGALSAAIMNPKGDMIATLSDGALSLWHRPNDGQNWQQYSIALERSDKVLSVAFSNDGQRVATAGVSKVVRVFNLMTGRQLQEFEGHDQQARAVAFSRDDRWVISGSDDYTARLWDMQALASGPARTIGDVRASVARCLTTEQRLAFFCPRSRRTGASRGRLRRRSTMRDGGKGNGLTIAGNGGRGCLPAERGVALRCL